MFSEIQKKSIAFIKDKQSKKQELIEVFKLIWQIYFVIIICFILCIGVPLVGVCALLTGDYYIRKYCLLFNKNKIFSIRQDITWANIKRILLAGLCAFCKCGIWLLIPFVGIIPVTVKAYECRLMPYILASDPCISPEDAVKKSKALTSGFKIQMFVLDLAILLCAALPLALLFALGLIPVIGIAFWVLMLPVGIMITAVAPCITHIVQCICYTELESGNIKPRAKPVYCPFCMSKMDAGCAYCSNCGEKLRTENS